MIVDAVIEWVDGQDPAYAAKLRSYATAGELSDGRVAGPERYCSLGEIHWCVASINRYAPWIRRIFIVTDGQAPCVTSRIPVEIVSHETIFEGYGQYLPVFNSRAIESMIWRIPGLSENFILFNDDFLLVRDVHQGDFFMPDGRPICYARPFWAPFARFKSSFKPLSFKRSLVNAAALSPRPKAFLYLAHTPRALKRSWFEEQNPVPNISCRFRTGTQFNSQALAYLSKPCVVKNPAGKLLCFKPRGGVRYLRGKLSLIVRRRGILFACFNSLSLASSEGREYVRRWTERYLNL